VYNIELLLEQIMLENKNCLIIGAGISGLMAAQKLKQNGIQVSILDKGIGVGGRLATRRIENGVFDHGAQFFTVREKVFQGYVNHWIDHGIVREWAAGVDNAMNVPYTEGHARYIGVSGMTGIAKYLAKDLDIHVNQKAETLEYSADKWQVTCESGAIFQGDILLLTAPLPQSIELLLTSPISIDDALLDQLQSIHYDPCVAVLVLVEGDTAIPEPGALPLSAEPLSWIGDNKAKGISPEARAITIHAGPKFSKIYWEMENDALARNILYIASDWIKGKFLTYQLKRWRYSLPRSTFSESHLYFDQPKSLLLAGDAFTGPRVEWAALSGLHAAEKIISTS
jgi:predicted NAD/FAD-dependent oxidoreductase